MPFLSSRLNRYGFELFKEVSYDTVGQRAAKLTVLKAFFAVYPTGKNLHLKTPKVNFTGE